MYTQFHPVRLTKMSAYVHYIAIHQTHCLPNSYAVYTIF